jgi:(p)ppGpp synthase/HD superfamily hydrolase
MEPPGWVSASPALVKAFSLAVEAHGSDRRPSDGRLFIEHVSEVAALLQRLEFDEELVAVGLLHDSIERGSLSEAELRATMGDSICDLVVVLSEDSAIAAFGERKTTLRRRVAEAGIRAVTVFAADKLSDIAGLRRRIEGKVDGAGASLATGVDGFAEHYRESVEMIASVRPGSTFLPALRRELRRLELVVDHP